MSQRDSEVRTIDGVVYEVFMLPPSRSMDLLVDIAKVVGPAFAAVASEDAAKLAKGEFDFARAAGLLLTNLDKSVLQHTIKLMSGVTRADSKPLDPILEVHFRGKLGAMAKWLGFALQVQYADFFGSLGSVLSLAGMGKAG